MPATVLLVEDDQSVATLVREALGQDYALVHASTTAAGWKLFESVKPEVAVLDVGLPDEDGLSLCRRIRAHASLAATPVIMLTGKGDLQDKMGGFEAGADHYLVKPFQIKELRLWVAALLRRVSFAEKDGGVLRAEDFTIDPQTHTVSTAGLVIRHLTRKEFDLLYELVRLRPKVLSKNFILNSLWHAVLRDNTVEVHIRNIRSKLGVAASRIVTVPGVGYRFE